MKEMKVRCTSREHADRVLAAARKMGYAPENDYKSNEPGTWDTLYLHKDASGDFQMWSGNYYPEYALYGDHLLPVSEGWIENKGECPVPKGTKIDVLYRDGRTEKGIPALLPTNFSRRSALCWGDFGQSYDIIAYRLAAAADAPVEWDGTGKPPVGARVLLPQYVPYREGPLSGVIVLPPDSEGDYVIKDDDGVYWWASADYLRPVRSERNKAAAEVVAQPTTEVSLRDRFAGKALAALLIANPDADCGPEGYAKDAYLYADAMMKVRGE